MDALLTTFLAALFAEVGDKTQLLAMLLAVRFRHEGLVLAGVAVAALVNAALAAAGGAMVAELIPFRALTLLVALALLSAGLGGLWPAKPPKLVAYASLGVFGASCFAFFVLEFGDKTQFLTFALAARADSPALAAAGAAAGVIAAAAPAVLLGAELERRIPLRALRYGVAALFLLFGAAAAIDALRLL